MFLSGLKRKSGEDRLVIGGKCACVGTKSIVVNDAGGKPRGDVDSATDSNFIVSAACLKVRSSDDDSRGRSCCRIVAVWLACIVGGAPQGDDCCRSGRIGLPRSDGKCAPGSRLWTNTNSFIESSIQNAAIG